MEGRAEDGTVSGWEVGVGRWAVCARVRLLGVTSNPTEFKLSFAIYWLSSLGSVS